MFTIAIVQKCNFSVYFCYFGISLCSHFLQAPKAMRILSSRLIKLSVESSSGWLAALMEWPKFKQV